MENASKALLISAGVLIAILLLTLFSYLMRQMGDSASGIYSTLSQHEITEFNQKFLNYEKRGIKAIGKDKEGKNIYNPLTVQDLATLINLAKDANNNSKFPTKIGIYENGIKPHGDWVENKNYIQLLNNNKDNPQKYDCKQVHINSKSMLVDYIIIKKHSE